MRVLVDTNLLLRSLQPKHEHYAPATHAIQTLLTQKTPIALVPQVAAEFWNVCTRPQDKNGLGLTIQQTEKHLCDFEDAFSLTHDSPETYQHWRMLVKQYEVQGVQVHDARLVAAMLTHGLTHILTFNGKDFRRYAEISILAPDGFEA